MRVYTQWGGQTSERPTVDEVMMGAAQDTQRTYGAKETRHPANQWLANHRARNRLALEVAMAGECATWQVRAGLDPEFTEADMLAIRHRAYAMGRRDLVAALRRGWAQREGRHGRV